MTYLGTKFEVATSNGLGGDTFARNVTDWCTRAHTHGWTDDDRSSGVSILKNSDLMFIALFQLDLTNGLTIELKIKFKMSVMVVILNVIISPFD